MCQYGNQRRDGEKAYAVHAAFAERNQSYDGVIIKKLDMGFRGNPAAEIEALLTHWNRAVCFVVPALPQFLTFTLYGNQYVKGRLLAESLYADDPIHKTKESFIPDIFKKGTALSMGCLDIDVVKGNGLLRAVEEKIRQHIQILIFDAVSDEDCYKIFQALYQKYPDALWAGTLGLLGGVTRAFYGEPGPEHTLPRAIRCAGFSGTVYDVTRRQMEYCRGRGMEVVPLQVKACLEADTLPRELERVAQICQRINETGDFMVVPEVPGELSGEWLPEKILKALTLCADAVCSRVQVGRIVIIGGETANAIFRKWKVSRMLVKEKPETGVAAGIFLDGKYTGCEFAAKGGSVGTVRAVSKMFCRE